MHSRSLNENDKFSTQFNSNVLIYFILRGYFTFTFQKLLFDKDPLQLILQVKRTMDRLFLYKLILYTYSRNYASQNAVEEKEQNL